jgi:hypothetical protein
MQDHTLSLTIAEGIEGEHLSETSVEDASIVDQGDEGLLVLWQIRSNASQLTATPTSSVHAVMVARLESIVDCFTTSMMMGTTRAQVAASATSVQAESTLALSDSLRTPANAV